MKFLLSGDWHFTNKTPSCRKDDYQQAIFNKLSFIYTTAQKTGAYAILQAGDLTDTPFLDYNSYISLYKMIKKMTYTIYGQHDLRYRNKGNTPLDALHETMDNYLIKIIGKEPWEFDDVHIYGASYGEDVPVIQNKEVFNILLIHKMLIEKKEADWQESYELGDSFLKQLSFDLIVSGDNHKSFYCCHKNRYLFNCGSLLRSTIDQVKHKPHVFLFDTDTREYEQIFIPITHWGKCFDLSSKIKEDEHNEHMETFIHGLTKHKDMGLNFVDNLFSYMKKNKIETDVEKIIKNNMNSEER